MTNYLLDTNIISDLLKHPEGLAARAVDRLTNSQLSTSIIIVAEIRFGLAKKPNAILAKRLDEILATMEVRGFDHPAEVAYAAIRTALERRGMPIGANDLLIAAHALALGCILVTANEREFRRVDGLIVENWLSPVEK